ncbi:hypothetical protein M9458_022492, partial [Cirrhinus mrigala]
MKLNAVGYRPSGHPLKLTISAKNGSEVGGFVVVQHQAQEAMAQILLAGQDDNRISEIHLASGRTKKKIPKLQPLLQRVLTMSASQN